MKTLTVIGRKWYQRSCGNTYNTAQIVVDGELVATLPKGYGYGESWLQRSEEWLDKQGFLPGARHYEYGGMEPLWQYTRERGIAFHSTATDVARERDL